MLWQRIAGALTFNRTVYEEVEKDTTFTRTAWLIVVVVSLLVRLASGAPYIATQGIAKWLLAALLGTAATVLAFAVAAWVITVVGMGLFNAEVTVYEMIRTLGLAYVWAIFGVLSVVGAVSPSLTSLVAPILGITWIVAVIAWVFAAKSALDLSWGKTLITVVIGAIVYFAIGELIALAFHGIGIELPSLTNALRL